MKLKITNATFNSVADQSSIINNKEMDQMINQSSDDKKKYILT